MEKQKKMNVVTIGRSQGNDIIISDVKVSRTHLQLVIGDNGNCSVIDLNSANGTFVNGQKITGEVRLQPNDVIRIGDTTLPWQNYAAQSAQPVVPQKQTHIEHMSAVSRKNKMWLYIVACVVILLAAGSLGLYLYINAGQQEKTDDAKQNQEEVQDKELQQETKQRTEEIKRLQDEADDLYRQALEAKSKNDKALAEAKQKEANEAKKQVEEAIAAQKAAEEKARIAAEKAKEEANMAKSTAEQNSKKVIQNAEEKANQAISKANKERDNANEKAKLTERFYEEYDIMKSSFAKQVCKQLQYELPKDRNNAKTALKNLFNQSDNKTKQDIIEAIQTIKQQSNSAEKL